MQNSIHPSQWRTFFWLIKRDLYKLNKSFTDTFIDMFIPMTVITLISGYIMPSFGLPASYGGFSAVGTVTFWSYGWPFWRLANFLLTDLMSDKSVEYELVLPMPSWMVFARIVTAWSIQISLVNAATIFVGKLILGASFDLSNASWSKYAIIYVLMTTCFCTFAGMIIFALKSTASFWQFASRAHFPIAFLGCYQFPWEMAYKAVWPLAIIDLANPFTYAVEGMRAAVLGQAGFLNYWLCLVMLMLFTALFFAFGVRGFKKKLDCV